MVRRSRDRPPSHRGVRAEQMVMTRTRYQAGIDEPSSSTASGILQAAIEEFDECGFAEASVGQIANRAGTSKSLVTYYFPTKSSLATSILALAHPNGVFMGREREASDPLDAILQAAEHIATCVAHHQIARVAIKLHHRRDIRQQGIPARYSGWLARTADYLEEAKRNGQVPVSTDVAVHSRLLVAGIAGLIDMATTTGDYLSLVDDSILLTRDRLTLIRGAKE